MARYPIKMLLDKDLGPFIPYLPSNAVVVEGSDETVADQIIDLHNEIEEKISNVYRYKGSVTFENLPTTGQVTGDVYNITNDFELDGHMYTAGTNVAWATDHWDPLTGLLNLDSTISELDLSVDLMTNVRSINGYAFTVEANKVQWLKMINDAIKAGKTTINFITTRDTGYLFRLYIPTTSDGVQNISMFINTPINLLYNLQYADTYWYGKTVKITFSNNVATDITVQTGSGYSYREWMYPQFRNTTAFTPTAATHLATKGYVDDAISHIPTGGSPVPIKYLNNNGTDFQTNTINGNVDATDLTNLLNAANAVLTDGYESFILIVNVTGGWRPGTICYLVKISSSDWDLLTFKCIGSSLSDDKVDSVGSLMNTFYIAGTRSGNTITALDNYVGGGGGGSFLLYTNNTSAYTPTLDYHPATKKYADDLIKGTDLSQYVELSQANPDVALNHVRYANIGDSFSLTYIANATANVLATAFYVKIPVSHYYKTTPSAYTYEPVGPVTYFEYDSQTQNVTPKNAYGYLTYNPSNPDYVEIKIYPVDYSGQTGILANSYFYVNCNWIRI